MRAAVTALLLFASGLAVAQTVDPQPPPPPRVKVAVGKTLEIDVGWARGGWFCDDTSLLTGELVTKTVGDSESNFWMITGVKAGTTECRIGNDRNRKSVMYDVTVTKR